MLLQCEEIYLNSHVRMDFLIPFFEGMNGETLLYNELVQAFIFLEINNKMLFHYVSVEEEALALAICFIRNSCCRYCISSHCTVQSCRCTK